MGTRTAESRRYYLKNRDRILSVVHAYRVKNRAKVRKRDIAKYANNAEFREKCKAYQKEYRKKYPEKVRELQRKYRKANWNLYLREYHNAWKRKWGKTSKGRIAYQLKGYRRRSLFKDIGTHTKAEWVAVIKKYKGRCAICEKKKKLTKDHVKPLTKGGRNTIDNIQPLCLPCNARKGNKI